MLTLAFIATFIAGVAFTFALLWLFAAWIVAASGGGYSVEQE